MNVIFKRASWLELFYDVAFIALVAQLTYLAVEHHHTLTDFINIFMVGYTIFIAWWATTANRNLQPTECALDKILTQVQMVAVFLMSIFMSAVFEGNYVGFFMILAFVRLLQSFMIIRMYVNHPQTRPVTYNILGGFFVASFLWAASALIGDPYHFVVAFAALAVDIFVPLTKGKGNTRSYLNVYHLQERLGLFLMLVIGESMIVVALSNSGTTQLFNQTGVVFSGLGIMIALWWLYFEYSDKHSGKHPRNLFAFLHSHGLLFGSIVIVSVGYKIILDTFATQTAFLFVIAGMAGISASILFIRLTLYEICLKATTMSLAILLVGVSVAVYGYMFERYLEAMTFLTVLFIATAIIDYFGFFESLKKQGSQTNNAIN